VTNPKDFYLAGQAFAAPALAAGLYIVATPIGNLRDITVRALETLAAVDMILCEDTRQSARLLTHYGIKTHRSALHEHNERERMGNIVDRLGEGQAIALISDAGTPLLSDPGFPLVRAVREAGFEVFAVPGASALLAALTIAGLPTDRFSFIGFLPPKQGARASMLLPLANNAETLVFYESPRRLAATLGAMVKVFGPAREAAVALELTKRFERVQRGTLAELEAFYDADETKGEAVILVAGAVPGEADAGDWEAALVKALEDQPLRAAVDEISTLFSLKRKQVYDAALALRQTKG